MDDPAGNHSWESIGSGIPGLGSDSIIDNFYTEENKSSKISSFTLESAKVIIENETRLFEETFIRKIQYIIKTAPHNFWFYLQILL